MIEIHQKSDIIVPFTEIGTSNWGEKTQLIIASIADIWEDEMVDNVQQSTIDIVEERLKTSLPDFLKIFYLQFGLADIQDQLQMLEEIGYLQNIWKDSPQYGPDFSEEDKQHLPHLVTFSESGGGNIVCFHNQTHEIFLFDHDSKPHLIKLFNHASDYLKACLISCQADLFGETVDQEKVEEWCEEILIEHFGEETIHHWKY